MVILDKLTSNDIYAYNNMLDSLPHRELICGFLSGKNELLNWEPSDLFQFYYDTMPIKGSLGDLLPLLDSIAVDRAVKIAACNIYHGCVHNMLYEKSEEILAGLYKAASFVVQAVIFRRTGKYEKLRSDILCVADADERQIIEAYSAIKSGSELIFTELSDFLFNWSRKLIGG